MGSPDSYPPFPHSTGVIAFRKPNCFIEFAVKFYTGGGAEEY